MDWVRKLSDIPSMSFSTFDSDSLFTSSSLVVSASTASTLLSGACPTFSFTTFDVSVDSGCQRLSAIFSLKLANDANFDDSSLISSPSEGLAGLDEANFLVIKRGVLDTFCEKVLIDCFILSTFSGLVKSEAKPFRRCSSKVSRVMELSMIF